MVSIDSSLIVQIINFVFLIVVLNTVLYKPIRKALLERKEKVASTEQKIATFNKGVAEKNEAFAVGIKESRVKGVKERDLLLDEAANEEKAIIEKINQKAQDDMVVLRKNIERDTKDVMASLNKELNVFAGAIGKKVLGRAV